MSSSNLVYRAQGVGSTYSDIPVKAQISPGVVGHHSLDSGEVSHDFVQRRG